MDPNFIEQREDFRENLTLGLIPALGILKLWKRIKVLVYYDLLESTTKFAII